MKKRTVQQHQEAATVTAHVSGSTHVGDTHVPHGTEYVMLLYFDVRLFNTLKRKRE